MIPPLRMSCEQSPDGQVEAGVSGSSSPVGASSSLVVQLGGWQLHRAGNCRSVRTLGLEQGSGAKHWLQAYRKDPFAMAAMRSVLRVVGPAIPMNRLREEDVIEQVAQLVKSGRWHVCQPVTQVYSVLPAEEPAVMPVPRWSSAASSAPAPFFSDVPELPSLPANADQAAIASAMKLAAQLGVPFCEECMKASLRRAAAAAAIV